MFYNPVIQLKISVENFYLTLSPRLTEYVVGYITVVTIAQVEVIFKKYIAEINSLINTVMLMIQTFNQKSVDCVRSNLAIEYENL